MKQHSENSTYREMLIEHLFVSELLKISWLEHECRLEISRPEVDNAGYDLIGEMNGKIRHIQLKASIVGGSTASQKIHVRLAEKPSGCVVWVYFCEETLGLGPFLFFDVGADALKNRPAAKHTKGNQDGKKLERPNLRVVNRGDFMKIYSVSDVFKMLFL
jgi:hypothetical protein